ncbi:DUF885 family protein [Aestuariivivens sediminis]|uniref:DUF885 family protein n=1 Tax=Aestuariivivens sediminis TaxID=2913557 RepID=UPI001F5AACAE|nr:DUF885 family protein [Aestuariivivens sediminis]
MKDKRLSYKIGQFKIRELGSRPVKALGECFDIEEFHQQIWETGGVPLQLLEEKIDRWISSSK